MFRVRNETGGRIVQHDFEVSLLGERWMLEGKDGCSKESKLSLGFIVFKIHMGSR